MPIPSELVKTFADNVQGRAGRKATISDEAILAAGDALQRQGRQISKWGLHKIIGGGNPQRLLEVWQHHRGDVEAPAAASPSSWAAEVQDLAGKFHDQTTKMIGVLYQTIEQTLERRHSDVARQLRDQLADIEESATALAQDNEMLQSERDDLERELANLRDEFSQAAGRQEQTDTDLTAIRAEASQLQTTVDSLRDELGRARQQLADLPALHAQLQAAERARQAAEQSQASTATELNMLREQRQEERERAAQALERVEQLQQRLEQEQAQRQAAQQDLAQARSELASAGAAAAKAEQLQAKMEAELVDLRAGARQDAAEVAKLQAGLQSAQEQLQDARTNLDRQQQENQRLIGLLAPAGAKTTAVREPAAAKPTPSASKSTK
ncbi:hypothetical protein HA052_27030 [Chromobacterium haemolyticum]|uniref:KfrA N-terminal DNA-binding domain-containing protein n=1 Tax=Chromobacterium fluminis TaxID=3044269 RepID=A0ABX0LAZ5_9NEIS|nr:DNA-binding protein [Chromobacterium haemolyticum]NHR08845.1 hypothetical protein [Chromobacterium haemolyticum]